MHTTTKIPRALPKTQCSQIKKKKMNMVLSANKYGSEQGPILALMEAIKNSVIGKNNTEQSSWKFDQQFQGSGSGYFGAFNQRFRQSMI